MITVFLGAGFSTVAGLPLASELFSDQPYTDILLREHMVQRVLNGWDDWQDRRGGTPEQYLTHLERLGNRQWREAVWYVALSLTLQTPGVRFSGAKPSIIGHSMALTTTSVSHELFWNAIFCHTENVTVLTTNYDVLVERALRPEPKPSLRRPGFHYGNGTEVLKGSVSGIFHRRSIETLGSIPLLKLHGSVSWAYGNGGIDHYHDCRPAIRGDAVIIAPATEKSVPPLFRPTWRRAAEALRQSNKWIVVGYSFPEYDETIRELFCSNAAHNPDVHILNPDFNVVKNVQTMLPNARVLLHQGLPDSIVDIPMIVT